MLLDRIPFIKRYREHKKRETALRYVAELGLAGFLAVFWLGAVLAVAELSFPGFAANYISPGAIFAALLLTGGLALAAPQSETRTRRQRLAYAAAGALAVVGAFSAAWYYFGPVPDARLWLSVASAAVVAGAFLVLED